jgi:hypothetical protein
VVPTVTPFNDYTIGIINSIPSKKLFNQMWDDYLVHLRAIDAAIYKGTVPGWYIRMDQIKSWAMEGYNTIKEHPVASSSVAFFFSQQDMLDTDYSSLLENQHEDKESLVA